MNNRIDAAFVNANPQWVLVVVERDGKRQLPISYEVNSYAIEKKEELLDKILKADAHGCAFKVYLTHGNPNDNLDGEMREWKKLALEYKKLGEDEKERLQYELLKAKFEKK